MAAPLFVMALLWDRFDLGHRRWLRGREVSFAGLRTHTASLLSGLMFVVLGVLFIVYDGTSALEGLYEGTGAGDLALAAQRWSGGVSQNIPAWLAPVVLLVIAGFWISRRWVRDRKGRDVRSKGSSENHRRA
jgi:hypothetical protein